MSGSTQGSAASPFKQPKAVFAVAFACVVSFMGIGLVDPILPAISNQLHASPSETTLLFTSYLVVTAVAMLITNWVSSRIGAKWTLICGLVLIVVFAALAGSSGSIGTIIGFRAGWGVGNALFIATSLAVIVASASGGFAGAIVLYETALGVGIAVGPLVGGTLGSISWRGPFYGVSVLMAIALIATVVLVEKTPRPAHPTSLAAPFRALRHRGLLTMALTALCYNWGFFTILGYAPFPMELSPLKLGLVFFGWGVCVALFAVFGAPRLQKRFGIAKTMYANLGVFAVLTLCIGIWTLNKPTLIVLVIASGIVCRREQHGDHPGGHDRVPGGAPGRVGRLQLRPVHRRRPRPLRGRPAGASGQHPLPVLHRGRRGRARASSSWPPRTACSARPSAPRPPTPRPRSPTARRPPRRSPSASSKPRSGPRPCPATPTSPSPPRTSPAGPAGLVRTPGRFTSVADTRGSAGGQSRVSWPSMAGLRIRR